MDLEGLPFHPRSRRYRLVSASTSMTSATSLMSTPDATPALTVGPRRRSLSARVS
jgi:hypothetical protein